MFFNWEEIEFAEVENKRLNIFIVGILFSIFIIDSILQLNNIDSIFLRIIAKSSLAVAFIFISIKYVNTVTKGKDRNK